MDTEQTNLDTLGAAPLPDALAGRFLAAMQAASAEETELRRTEAALRRLAPAEMPLHLMGQMGMGMYVAAAQARGGRSTAGRPWLRRCAAAAAALVCCAAGGLAFHGTAVADAAPQGLVSRSVILSRGGESVQWNADSTPVRSYEVTYEDTFVLDGDNGMTVTVRVPNRTTVTVPAEML